MRIGACVFLLTLLAWSLSVPVQAGQIQWRSGTVQVAPQDRGQIADTVSGLALRGAQRHFVVQFAGPITAGQRSALQAAGVTLQNYLGDYTFFAAVGPRGADPAGVAAVQALTAVLPIERDWKLHPDLVHDIVREWAVVGAKEEVKKEGDAPAVPADPVVGAYILFHADVALEGTGKNLVWRYGARVRSELRSINGLVIELPMSMIKPLAAEDGVQWIEPPLPKMGPVNNSNRARVGADIVQAPPYGLDGSGVTVLVYDAGTGYAAHQDFGGRLHVRDSSGDLYHSTHVAGTIGGSGAQSGGTYKGMAPGVIIESYGLEQVGGLHEGFLYTDPCDIEADYSQAINTYGSDIANNSIGTNTAPNGFPCDWEGNYGVTDVLIDTIVRGDGSNPNFAAPFRIVWANGNERQTTRCGSTYHTTAPPACAKNHITVGALNSNDDSVTDFTSWGPADDDRMKPDVSAPGCQSNDDNGVTSCNSGGGYTTLCGTSMASPTVCGLGALMLQDYRVQYPELPDFRNSTLKVWFAHTAVDLFNTGPDYQTGYGSVRVQPAIDLMRSGNWLENVLSQGDLFSVLVVVNPGDSQLKVTLAWDDVPGTPVVNPALVNDLDLRVFNPSNTQFYPWTLGGVANPSAPAVRTQPNHVDNLEQVVIDSPPPGVYRIEVYGFNVPSGPQPFSVTATPLLVACSPQGIIALDRAKYQCQSTATLRVVDCDLNTNDQVVETVTVTIASTSEPGGESVVLTESGPETATFLGTIALSTTNAAGVLQVANGDTVTATYIDADDGQGGTNVTVTDTAVVDCTPPQISNVQTTNIQPRSATVTFDTNELANGAVHYGLSCGALTGTVTESGYKTAHTFNLTGLQDDTTYFYSVTAEDEAGNSVTDNNGGSCYLFSTPQIPDFFTEEFAGADNDLDNLKLSFTPNGSNDFYDGCAEAITSLPTDPAGGTTLTLTDDSYATVNLGGGAVVWLYGQSYNHFYPGSNGYITFNTGDTTYTETLAAHFNQPRVTALFDDLNPGTGGTVSWKQLADHAAVTWQNVPEYGASTPNTFQIEMYFDGTLTISFLSIAATDGIAGLSQGNGVSPDFFETDLSAMGACGPQPPTAQNGSASTAVSTPVTVTLHATDDGLPNPPAALSYIIASLPAHGGLSDPGAGAIGSVPYTLVGNGNQVQYSPTPGYRGGDSFQFKANDGGTPPQGGDSNAAIITLTVGGAAWDPVAYNGVATTAVNLAVDITLVGTDPNNDPLTYTIEGLPAAGLLADPGAGEIATVPYTLVGGGRVVTYQPPCGIALSESFTFSVHDATAGSNIATVSVTVSASGPRRVYWFPLDTTPGWSVQGLWAFGQPTGGGSHNRDPVAGYTGANVYGYNLNGDYGNNRPAYYLTTTALNCANMSGTELRFRRWLGVERYDRATVEVSNNGTTWTPVWTNPSGSNISETAWSQQTYDLSAVADGSATVYLRWGMGPTDSGVTFPGWNLDDVELWGVVPAVPGDFNGDGLVNLSDLVLFEGCLSGPEEEAAVRCRCVDQDADGDVDLGDFTAFQAAFGE